MGIGLSRFLGSVTWSLADHGNPSPSVRCGLPTIRELSGSANSKAFVVTHSVVVDMAASPGNAFISRSTSTSFDKKM
jgi:hypothetical protein